jgi:hypothetical protein
MQSEADIVLLRGCSPSPSSGYRAHHRQVHVGTPPPPTINYFAAPVNVCSWWKSGRAAEITATTDVDPSPFGKSPDGLVRCRGAMQSRAHGNPKRLSEGHPGDL